jgi:hypothetical protein
VLVAPAVGEPLAETDTGDLPAQFGREAAAGIAGAGRHGTFDVTQLTCISACRERARAATDFMAACP